jgi:lactate dehydrogenase-like 2-hydroxyacid dehydrogenase
VPVANTPDALNDATADIAMLLLLGASQQTQTIHQSSVLSGFSSSTPSFVLMRTPSGFKAECTTELIHPMLEIPKGDIR